jgi:tRNA nucleotidyltransferase (CCA-adding enzyme)
MFRKVIPTGIQHGTVTVVQRGAHYEVTTLRGEGAYSDGRRPDSVEFVDDITADLARRDFTFNAIAIDPVDGHVIDPFGGQEGPRGRVLRAVGDAASASPRTACACCAPRASRHARVTIDAATEQAMGARAPSTTFRKVSAERVRDEWMKSHARAARAWPSRRCGAPACSPSPAPSCSSPSAASRTSGTRTTCGGTRWPASTPAPDPVLRVAALLHDVGKPRTRAFSDKTQDYTFYEHERVGAEMAEPDPRMRLASRTTSARKRGLPRPPPPHLLLRRLDRRGRAPLAPPRHARPRARLYRARLRRRARQGQGARRADLANIERARAAREARLLASGRGALHEGPGHQRPRPHERAGAAARAHPSARSSSASWSSSPTIPTANEREALLAEARPELTRDAS